MHLLFATSIVPDGALGSGYEIANEAIIDALLRAGLRVTVIGFAWPGRRPSRPADTIVLGELDVRTDGAPARRKLGWLATALSTGLTFSSAKLRAIDERVLRDAIAAAGPFDAFVVNSVQMAGAFEAILTERPYLFVAHNAEALSAQQNAASASGAFQRLLFRREARLLGLLEQRLCAGARHVFTLSEEDRGLLGIATGGRSTALPLVASLEPPQPPEPRAMEYDAALIGSWTWQPNRVGLEWFLAEVVPHLPPGFRVSIAGGMPSDIVSAHPGVSFAGRVPDAKDFLRKAAFVPLVSRGGTGVQLKTIETFEMGLPSVATTSALRGIRHKPANCIVCDEPQAFAQAMLRLAAAPWDVDGRAFHASQRDALDRSLHKGLAAIGWTPVEVAA